MPEVRLIDASALKDTIRNIKLRVKNPETMSALVEMKAAVLREIEAATTIEAEPVRHGRWENGKCTDCKHNLIELCGGEDYELAMYAEFDAEFCPFCGARMYEGADKGGEHG